MAFYGSLGEVNLDNLDASIADTAVDVFVYDTRKDSDGGAWRYRTQHTSWYNETLNTATRGSRREFPAVAVIVAEASKVTIYDGDDPDLPMWMVFNRTANWSFITYASSNISSIFASNGLLCSAANTVSGGLNIIKFVEDTFIRYQGNNEIRKSNLDISNRNINQSTTPIISVGSIVNGFINDVAMTVLPNAPIDPSTGLPIPTIAVATDGGVSVIKDDGSVVDYYDGYPKSLHLIIDSNNKIMMYNGYPSNALYAYATYIDIPSSDYSTADKYTSSDPPPENVYNAYSNVNISGKIRSGFDQQFNSITSSQNSIFFGFDHKLSILDNRNQSSITDMVAYATTSYNSGWLHGDIKGAFLADTDDTNVTAGNNYVTNGTFDSDSDWIKYNNTTVWTISGGTATMSATGLYLPLYQYNLGLTAGKRYVASVDVIAITGQLKFDTSNSTGGDIDENFGMSISTTGTHTFIFTAESDQDGIGISRLPGYTSSCTIDNITIYELQEEDRSVNNKGLQVFGTITKTPVATGAELVGYSGFSPSNYLQQPYNPDLDFGTGEFCVMGWFKASSSPITAHRLYRRGAYNGNWIGGIYSGYINTNNTIGFNITPNGYGTIYSISSSGTYQDGNWHYLVQLRNSSGLYQYIDGRLDGFNTNNGIQTANLNNSIATFILGGDQLLSITSWSIGDMALWRISASAPSAEQIKKIYEDEKVLFQENAACTLYGSSDAVTALAYDEDLQTLHVGTSSGRSDFQGLRRINNTTTAVTTAISASDGLIVEQ